MGERPQAKDETGVEHDVDRVRQPERPHGNRGVAGPPKDRVDQEQEQHRATARQHGASVARAHHLHRGTRAHQLEELGGKQNPDRGHDRGDAEAERDSLHGCAGGAGAVLLADAPGDHGAEADGEPDRHGVDHDQHGLREPDGCHGVGAEPGDEEDVHQREQGLHGGLQHHRDRQQEQRTGDRPAGIVLMGAPEGGAH